AHRPPPARRRNRRTRSEREEEAGGGPRGLRKERRSEFFARRAPEETTPLTRSRSFTGLHPSPLRRFFRPPARIFWVYGFPTVLAIGLGLAFKGGSAQPIQLDLVQNAAAPAIEKVLRAHDAQARQSGKAGMLLRVEPADVALRRLATGKTPLVVI